MLDHFHWLMQLKEGYELSSVVRYVKADTTRGVRRIAEHIDPVWQRGFIDPVWQRGFHDRAIRSEENLVDYARYIVANPLRAGIAGSIRQYPLWDAKWV
ncbi:REP-associated tyrosine transposase [Marinobacterium jannaschii]|uniref:REP-associated tyrosine transposase n=1 Tax=Marinobacterium jannaschii TaxID=64970 RepID=UPI002ADE2B42|nr:transposase [Marinobacterium jannaschii]